MEKCPFCNGEHFLRDTEKNLYTCFDCFWHGNYTDLLCDISSRSPADVKGIIKDNDNQRLLDMNKAAADYYFKERFYDDARAYIKKRELSADTCRMFKIGYAPGGLRYYLTRQGYSEDEIVRAGLAKKGKDGKVTDVFWKRVIFPIYDEDKNILGFGGRRVDDKMNPKYLNSRETSLFNKRDILYGIHDVDNFETVYLVEGFVDVVSLHQAGVRNSLAALGVAVGRRHCQLLKSHGTKKIVLCLDSDLAGQNAAIRSIGILREYFDIDVLAVPGAKDPDEFLKTHSGEEFKALKTISWQKFLYQKEGFTADMLLNL